MPMLIDCRMTKSACNAVACAAAFLVFAIACPQAVAKSVAKHKQLDSFCGFKAGEAEARVKVAKSETIVDDGLRARSPFRSKFREVKLTFDKGGKLVGVCAYAMLPNARTKAVKTELEACCKELTARHGIKFGDWVEADGEIRKDGVGEGVSVGAAATFDSSEERGKKNPVVLSVDVSWDWYFACPMIPVKAGAYSQKGGQIRRAFIENAFGVKFNETLPEHIKAEKDEESTGIVIRRLSAPVCGCSLATLVLGYGGKLSGLDLMSASDGRTGKTADAAQVIAKSRVAEACKSVEKWLGVAPLEIIDGVKGAENGVYIGGKPVVASFEDDNISVTVNGVVLEDKDAGTWGTDCQIKIDYNAFCNETVKHMKGIYLPSFSFKPPSTVKDVFDHFQKAAMESCGGGAAANGGGIDFAVDKEVGALIIPAVSAGRMSLYDAVKLVCGVVCCDYEVSRGKVVVKPRK